MKNILVLCTGNSARSILGEALFNQMGEGRVVAYSAGSDPRGDVHPAAIKLLEKRGFETHAFRSKKWDEFELDGAPQLDIVITVCDSASEETCPVWPGAPVQAHWGIADPAKVEGAGQMEAFEAAFSQLEERIKQFLALPFETLKPDDLRRQLSLIGSAGAGATEKAKNTQPLADSLS